MAGSSSNPPPFNGLHLRVENDTDEVASLGGMQGAWDRYDRGMKEGGFDATTPVYVASGLLTYMTRSEFESCAVDELKRRSLASEVFYKEMFVDKSQLAGLHSEALGMLDLLVLVRARRFTGYGPSTLSWYAREARCQLGTAAETTILVGDANPVLHVSLDITNYTLVCPPPAAEAN